MRLGLVRRAYGEVVDVLRAPGRLTGERQPFLVAQQVDGGGLARVRAARESDLRLGRRRQVLQVIDRCKETGLMEQK